MKIALDISQIAYKNTGVANYTEELVKNLLAVDKKNSYILFGYSLRRFNILRNFVRENIKKRENIQVKLIPLPQSAVNLIWNKLHIINLEKIVGRIDIYHSSDWIQAPAAALKVTTIHDMVVYRFPQTSDPYILNTQKVRLTRVRSDCDLILADSNATKKDIIDILKILSSKIKVVYPGVRNIFRKTGYDDSEKILKKYQIKGSYILFVGTNEPRKNLKTLIAAYHKFKKKLLESNDKIPQLLLVGKYGWGEKIQNKVGIRVLNTVENSDLPYVYSKADMLVYPSLYEGFGLPVLEAMRCGCPVVTSGKGSLAEIAGKSALIVDPLSVNDIFEKIYLMYKDVKLRKRMIEKGYANSNKFTWENTAKYILSCYQSLVR